MKKKKDPHRHTKRVAQFEELAGDSYNELQSHYPATALAMASLGQIVPSLAECSGLTTPLFKHKGKH